MKTVTICNFEGSFNDLIVKVCGSIIENDVSKFRKVSLNYHADGDDYKLNYEFSNVDELMKVDSIISGIKGDAYHHSETKGICTTCGCETSCRQDDIMRDVLKFADIRLELS